MPREELIDSDLPLTNPEVVQGRDYRPGHVPFGGNADAPGSPIRHDHSEPDHVTRGPASPGSERRGDHL